MADLLSTGISGVRTYQRALATVGNNIANVDTEGYSRQRVDITENASSSAGSLSIGNGANAVRVQRFYDEFVVGSLRSSQSQLSKNEANLTYISELENILGDPRASISSSLDGFFSAVQEVSLSPASVPARQNLLDTANTTASRFTAVGAQLSQIEQDSYGDLKENVNALNQLAGQLATINLSLNGAHSKDKQPNELLDRRDSVIQDINKLLRVSTIEKNNGSVDIQIGNIASGQYLVKGSQESVLGATRSTDNSDKVLLTLNPFSAPQAVTQIVGGSIAGISEFRENTLTTLRDELDNLVQVFVSEVNDAHELGINANSQFGGDLFSLGNIYSVTPGINAGTGFVTVGAVPNAKIENIPMELTYSDSTKLWTLTNTNTKAKVSGPSGLTMGGVKVTIAGVPNDGDTFSLKSDKRSIDALQVSILDYREIASGGAISSSSASTNASTTKVILDGYSKPTAAKTDTSMGTALRNNISQVAASNITPGTNTAFVIPANTQNSQFYSTEAFPISAVLEVDTYTIANALTAGTSTFSVGGNTYSQLFTNNSADTLTALALQITNGEAGMTAAKTSSTTLTITANAGSNTQQATGTFGGFYSASGTLTGSKYDTTVGIAASTASIQMQVFTREGKQLYGSALSSSDQTLLLTSHNGFNTTAAYDSTYRNQTGSNAYLDADVTVVNPTLTTAVPATATMTISGSAIKATDQMTMTAGSATFDYRFLSDGDLATSATAYVNAWNASTDTNVSLYTASNLAGAITIKEDIATSGRLVVAGSATRNGGGSNIAVSTPAAAGTTGIRGDVRDYFAMAGSLKEDLLVFVTGSGTAEVSGQWGSLATGAAVLEVDTITLAAPVAALGTVTFRYGGTNYTQAFDTDAATTISKLVVKINAGTAGSTVTAAAVNGTTFTMTMDAGSATQMTKGTIGGTTNGSARLSITTADTTTGVSAVSDPLLEKLRQNIDIQFSANASSYVLVDTDTQTNIANGTFIAGSTIEHNGWKVSFDGAIEANDKFSLRGNNYQAGDNRNLLNMIELQSNKDIFSGRGDFTEVYTDIMGGLGNSLVQAAVSRDAQQIVVDQAQSKRDETSAVSLDEEAANLLRFQQAYQASAQIISAANKLFDTILSLR